MTQVAIETRLPGGDDAAPISAYEPGDWRKVPPGYYAIPVYDWMKFGDDCGPDGTEPVLELLGYVLFQRKTSRVIKTGKKAGQRVGQDNLVGGRRVLASGVTEYRPYPNAKGELSELRYTPWDRLTQEVQNDRFVVEHDLRREGSKEPLCQCGECTRVWRGHREKAAEWVHVSGWEEAYKNAVAAAILENIERGGDTYRALYGQLTGHCGHCGKLLTDPESKLRGIGPDCAGRLRKIAALLTAQAGEQPGAATS
jgi:hypothetical protein